MLVCVVWGGVRVTYDLPLPLISLCCSFFVSFFAYLHMICGICSSVIIIFLICMCNVAVLLNYTVTLVRLSLVTNKGYLLTYLLTYDDIHLTVSTVSKY